MKKQIEKCPICSVEFEVDSKKYYWHLKIHKAKDEAEWAERITPNKPFKNPYTGDNKMYETGNDYCLHDNCSGCKSGTCNGFHMLSCPCRKCSPTV